MSKARGLISGEADVHLRTSGMYDSVDNVRLSHISAKGLSSLNLMHSNLIDGIASAGYDFTWSKDGFHLYVVQSDDYIRHYTVTAPFSSTGKTLVESFYNRTYEDDCKCFEMSPDGKYFYIGGTSRDGLVMFETKVPYYMTDGAITEAVSRGTFCLGYNQHNSFIGRIDEVGDNDDYVRGLEFNGDGTKLYLVGYGNDTIQQFSLSTPYKIGEIHDSSIYDGAYDVGADGFSTPINMKWNNDGTKFFLVDRTSTVDSVIEYSVSNAYDVTSGTITEGTNFSVQSYETTPNDVAFNADGTKMFVIGETSDKIHEWTLSTGFDLSSTVTYVSGTSLGISNPSSFDISSDGTLMVVTNYYQDRMYGFTMSTPFDSSTISLTQTHITNAVENSSYQFTNVRNHFEKPYGCRFNGDGTSITLIDLYSSTNNKMVSIPLVVPYDIRGLADGCLNTRTEGLDYPMNVRFSSDGKKVQVLDGSDDRIYQWVLHTPFVLGRGSMTAVYEGYSDLLRTGDGTPIGFDWTPDGKGLFVAGLANDTINYYDVSTPFDATSTVTYRETIDITYIENYPYTVRVVNCHSRNDGGYKLQLLGIGSDDIFEFDINF